ncbi:MAG: phosphatase PAP2 family protein [Prevotella sp.]|nr:phosphatase PAP2 family protein [Prevotella sp.]
MAKGKYDITDYFVPTKKRIPMHKGGPLGMGFLGFTAPELMQMAYALFTTLLILFTWTGVDDAAGLLWQRVTALSGTLVLWVVYQLWPCKAVMMCRMGYLLLMLGFWYPDTYEINQQFGSYDHVFAGLDQSLFGCQPALLFSERFSSRVVSELMYMGYVSYYLFFVVTVFLIFIRDYRQVERVAYMIFGGFFLCYVVFLLLPVTGPQYYYLAAGTEAIRSGSLPDIGHYFSQSTECLQAPGWRDGIFYNLCQMAHQTGERPTAAFPSSHVAIATLVMAICAKMRMWRWLTILAVPYLFLCMSTVYIQAHYAVDSIAGFFTGLLLFIVLGGRKLQKVS